MSETGAPLSDAARWSKRLRADLSAARIVTGPRAEGAAAALGTAAFTVGNRVFLGAGVTPSDETVLAHELTHVVQQMGATLPSPDQLKMTSPDDPVEREARGEGGDHPHGAAPGAHGAAPGAHGAGARPRSPHSRSGWARAAAPARCSPAPRTRSSMRSSTSSSTVGHTSRS